MKIAFTSIFLFLCLSLFSQKEDYIWLTGYRTSPDSLFGGTKIDFNTEPPTVSYQFMPISFFLSDASIADQEGNLIFYTDGVRVVNRDHEIMENGDSLGLNDFHYSKGLINSRGTTMYQGAIILKIPKEDSLYLIIHAEVDNENPPPSSISYVQRIFYSIVNINQDEDNGRVIEKNSLLLNNGTGTYLEQALITATRHANGRDWWIIIGERNTNIYHTFLLGPEGIDHEQSFVQSIGLPPVSGGGQAVFSPDGSKYATFGVFNFDEPGQINVFDFDRCNGMLTNPLHIPIDTTEEGFVDGALGGLAFSPNSEILYHPRTWKIFQYDLMADDVIASADTVAFYDDFADPINGFPTVFGAAQLAPNGKIYIATPNNTRFMHVIHHPDERGIASDVEQHGLQLATFNDWSIPNHPNYRLKALIGSPCDTIRPLAAFTYDSLSNTVFTDQSERMPTTWFWTFGDGGSSSEQNPTYTYTENGSYEVCLIATNEAGSDTTCQTITMIVTNTNNLAETVFMVYPNPTDGVVTVVLPDSPSRTWRLYNALGQKVKQGRFGGQRNSLDLSGYTNGVYWLEVMGLGSEKILLNGK